jgi:SAM-dependent methyltransferase
MIADLNFAHYLPSEAFDCIIFTQTLQYVYEVRRAINALYRMLRPNGVLLATFPGLSKKDADPIFMYQFTTHSAECLFGEVFPSESLEIEAHGNVLTAVAFLHGLAAQELTQEELEYNDPDYEVLITVRAVKSTAKS